jgi:hypothetical protein
MVQRKQVFLKVNDRLKKTQGFMESDCLRILLTDPLLFVLVASKD